MKLTTAAALLATASLVAAQPHAHKHRHNVKRDDSVQYDVVHVMVYELNGHPISKQEVDEGLKNGTLVMAPNGQVSSVAAPAPAATPVKLAPSAPAGPPPSSAPAPPVQPEHAAPAPVDSSSGSSGSSDTGATGSDADWSNDAGDGVDTPFPDGQIDCSVFPEKYGAKPVPWMNVGGWSAIQVPPSGSFPGLNKGAITDIKTQVPTECDGPNCCSGGAFCSYACGAGLLKSQYPVGNQGQTGQSVGGLFCSPHDNKLYLTNPQLSDKLCIKGASKVDVTINSGLSNPVAVCRTDYPGAENMNIPTLAMGASGGSNGSTPLACVNAATYYHWQGATNSQSSATSGQYYVNPSKYSVSEGCWWNNPGTPAGNFAPVILGVGVDPSGKGWFAIQHNSQSPAGSALDFGISIKSSDGVNFCRYEPGTGFTSVVGTNQDGCTVSSI
jgi:SUN family beta-glucosidase